MNKIIAASVMLTVLLSGICSAQTGSISGSVKNGMNQPISSTIVLATPSGDITTETETDASGNYTLSALFPGSYRLYTLFSSRGSTSYIEELYNNNSCVLGICDVSAGTPVVVGSGSVTGINFVLSEAGSISGNITSGGSTTQITVHVFNSSGTELTFFSSNPDGTYTIPGLGTGSYYLATSNEKGFIDQLYNNVPCPGQTCAITSGASIAVTAPNPVSNVNFSLAAGGAVSGVTRNGDGTKTLDGAELKFYSESGDLIESRSSSFDGTYETGTGLPSGNYFVTVHREDYVDQIYSGINCIEPCQVTSGTPLAISAPQTLGLDFNLQPRFDLTAKIKKIKAPNKQMAKVTIFNNGLETAPQLTVRVYLSETNPKSINAKLVKEQVYSDFAGQSQQTIKIKRRKLGAKKFLVVEADSDDVVAEADESNNIVGKKLK